MTRTEPARGMRDFLPEDVRRRSFVIGVIAGVYEQYGFEPLETPAAENLETLLGKYGEEGNRLIFKILKRGEHEASGQADLALRYDLTVPLARVMAEHRAALPRVFMRYQIQPVWRADRPARGRFREFYQCDVDTVGPTAPVVEAELCAAVSEALAALGFEAFEIRLNHRGLLTAILESAGVPDAAQASALVALDKLDRLGVEGVSKELVERGVEERSVARLLDLFGTPPSADRLDAAARFVGDHAAGTAALENLRAIVTLSGHTAAAGRIRFDPSLARGLSYYTGAIMEITVPDLAGSLGGGGRYDNLIGMFSGQTLPACGFSLGLERILVVMGERGMFPPTLAMEPADVLVSMLRGGDAAGALLVASVLRRSGLRVMVYPDADKIGKQIKYASARSIPCVAILGEDEIARGDVTLKYLASGHQETVTLDRAGAAVKQSARETRG